MPMIDVRGRPREISQTVSGSRLRELVDSGPSEIPILDNNRDFEPIDCNRSYDLRDGDSIRTVHQLRNG